MEKMDGCTGDGVKPLREADTKLGDRIKKMYEDWDKMRKNQEWK